MSDIEIPVVVSESSITEDYLGLVNNILRECGERTVSNLTSPTAITQLAMDYLNYTVVDICNKSRWWFLEATKTYAPVAGQATYALPSNFDKMASKPRYTGAQLVYISPDDLDRQVPDRSTSGTPTNYTIWNDNLEFYPTPSSDFISDDVVEGTDSSFYVSKTKHTATNDDKPITGADYADNWVLDSAVSSGSTWTLGQAYEDKRIIMRYWRRPVAMANDGDYPDMPDKFIEIIKIGARARLKEYLESPDFGADYQIYNVLLREQMRRRNRTGPKTVGYLR